MKCPYLYTEEHRRAGKRCGKLIRGMTGLLELTALARHYQRAHDHPLDLNGALKVREQAEALEDKRTGQ